MRIFRGTKRYGDNNIFIQKKKKKKEEKRQNPTTKELKRVSTRTHARKHGARDIAHRERKSIGTWFASFKIKVY